MIVTATFRGIERRIDLSLAVTVDELPTVFVSDDELQVLRSEAADLDHVGRQARAFGDRLIETAGRDLSRAAGIIVGLMVGTLADVGIAGAADGPLISSEVGGYVLLAIGVAMIASFAFFRPVKPPAPDPLEDPRLYEDRSR